jgi:hypothetical protein
LSAFEFFFTLYGLVLGLSVVEIVSGFARLAHDRRGVKIGWLTPMLAILLTLDLANFWVNAYSQFQVYALSYGLLVISLAISALYYVAASVVFPRDFSAEPDFDAFYFRHRRLVMGILVLAGVTAFELLPMMTAEGRAGRAAVWTDLSQVWNPLLFLACAAGIMLTRNIRVNVALLAVLIAVFAVGAISSLPPERTATAVEAVTP